MRARASAGEQQVHALWARAKTRRERAREGEEYGIGNREGEKGKGEEGKGIGSRSTTHWRPLGLCGCVCAVPMVHTSIGCVLGRSGLTVSNKSIEQRLSLSRS